MRTLPQLDGMPIALLRKPFQSGWSKLKATLVPVTTEEILILSDRRASSDLINDWVNYHLSLNYPGIEEEKPTNMFLDALKTGIMEETTGPPAQQSYIEFLADGNSPPPRRTPTKRHSASGTTLAWSAKGVKRGTPVSASRECY